MPKATLTIESILGGQAPSKYFNGKDQYQSSLGIDPDFPIGTEKKTSGAIVPTVYEKFSSSNIDSYPMWMISSLKDNNIFTYGSGGKLVRHSSALAGETLIGTPTSGAGNGGAYYNNYIYLATPTDVSRMGPMNTLPYDGQSGNFTVGLTVTGATSGATGIITADVDGGATGTLTLTSISGLFVDNETVTDTSTGSAAVNRPFSSFLADTVWTGATLGSQTALTNTLYPSIRGIRLPNHAMHAHTDGVLYLCDFKNGQGLIHKISTKRVTNEGDTNDTTVPSAYSALDLNYGFYPTDIESYNTDIVISAISTTDSSIMQGQSALFFWDTTSASFYRQVPIADPYVTALLNVNGVLHVFSGSGQGGVRISQYLGGDSIAEIAFLEDGFPPFPGAVEAVASRIFFGTPVTEPSVAGTVYSFGSKKSSLPQAFHCVIKSTSAGANPVVTSIKAFAQDQNVSGQLVVGWGDDSAKGMDKKSSSGTFSDVIRFPWFNVGRKFKIEKIQIPLAVAVAANMSVTPKIYTDDSLTATQTLTAINNTNYFGKRNIVYKNPTITVQPNHNFMLELNFAGTVACPVNFPITIELDIVEDE